MNINVKTITLFLLSYTLQLKGQETTITGKPYFTVASFNCENLFDTLRDTIATKPELLLESDDFLPGGSHRWNRGRLWDKLRNIAKIIAALDSEYPVDVICLEEVENDTIVDWLVNRTQLRRLGYHYHVTHSHDKRGIDIAVLYQPFSIRMLQTRSIHVPEMFQTRDMIHFSGEAYITHRSDSNGIAMPDTIDIIGVHLPSKLGGTESKWKRAAVCGLLRTEIDSIYRSRSEASVIALGDFNDGPESQALRYLTDTSHTPALTNLFSDVRGTYKYQGIWETIDQVLINEDSRLHVGYADAVWMDWLMESDAKYGGWKPRRSFLGPVWHGGVSDHMPILVRFY